MQICLQRSCYHTIIQHCKNIYPEEACGVLLGTKETESYEKVAIIDHIAISNIHQQKAIAFQFAPEQWVNAYYYAHKNGLDIVGIYHSHPFDEPTPSLLDVQGFIANDMLYAIVGLKQKDSPQIEFYQLNTVNQFINYPLVLT